MRGGRVPEQGWQGLPLTSPYDCSRLDTPRCFHPAGKTPSRGCWAGRGWKFLLGPLAETEWRREGNRGSASLEALALPALWGGPALRTLWGLPSPSLAMLGGVREFQACLAAVEWETVEV